MQVSLVVVPTHQFVCPDVPDHYRTAAVLTFGNDAFKIKVLDRMVFRRHREPLFGRLNWRPLWNSPGLERVMHLEPEVIMEMTCRMLLNDEPPRASLPAAPGCRSRLPGFCKVPF